MVPDLKSGDGERGLDGDFLEFMALKANDLEISPDDPKLIEHCRAAFNCFHCAGFAFMAVALSAEPGGRFWFVIEKWNQWLRGLPGPPIPQGDPLDAIRAISPLLEVLTDRCTRDLDIRRVLQRLEVDDCGCLPPGEWDERTSHRAAVRFAENVLNDIWKPVVGIASAAEVRSKDVPRFDAAQILSRHRGLIRRSLKKYQRVKELGLLRGINDEVGRALTGRHGKARTTILYLAADPSAVKPSEHLRLDEEVRAIGAEIRASVNRDELDLRSAWAVRATDLSREMLFHAPTIVHFGCHGDFVTLELEAERAQTHLVTHLAVRDLFRMFSDGVRLVILNVCNSAALAKELVAHVDCAIGMNGSISDESAGLFACAVYRGLASGRSVSDSFELGRAELALHDRPDADMPVIASRKGVDPLDLYFTGPSRNTIGRR